MNIVHFINIVNTKVTHMTKKCVFYFYLCCQFFLYQRLLPQDQSPLNRYIQEGIKNNLILRQKKISYQKAVYALRSATSLFLPSVTMQAGYSSGDGGRSIDIPVGDLMNPVYQTLNELTGTNNFPQIKNVKENLFPNRFYDIRLSTSMPILNTDIIFNREIERAQLTIKDHEVELYRKELIKEIKTAYYNYLSSLEAVKIYNSALDLAREGKRMNESLLKNGSGLPVYLLRSDSEIESVMASLNEVAAKSDNAKKYFNFLLNRDLNTPVETMTVENPAGQSDSSFFNISNREEMKILHSAVRLSESVLKMNRYYWIPKISGFVDLGAQNSNWKYNKESRYYLYGLQLEFPVFEGFRNSYKIQIARNDLRNAELEYDKTEKALSLSRSVASNDLRNAIADYQSSLKRLQASQSYYNLIIKGYREGTNAFIETVDARNQLTASQLSANINKFRVYIAQAAYERENGSLNSEQE